MNKKDLTEEAVITIGDRKISLSGNSTVEITLKELKEIVIAVIGTIKLERGVAFNAIEVPGFPNLITNEEKSWTLT